MNAQSQKCVEQLGQFVLEPFSSHKTRPMSHHVIYLFIFPYFLAYKMELQPVFLECVKLSYNCYVQGG